MELICPLVVRCRLLLGIQMLQTGYSGPLTDMMLGESIFQDADNTCCVLLEWLPYVQDEHGGNMGATLKTLIHCTKEKDINHILGTFTDKKHRTILRLGWVAYHLHKIEQMIMDGEPIAKVITKSMYKKIDDGMRGFLESWCDEHNAFSAAPEAERFSEDTGTEAPAVPVKQEELGLNPT